MAKPDAILQSDRSAASTVAVTVLCVLGLFQLGTMGRSLWKHWREKSMVTAPETAPPQPVAPPVVQANLPPSQPPALPSPVVATPTPAASIQPATTQVPASISSGLPPLPPVPARASAAPAVATNLPPLPSATATLPPLPALPGKAQLQATSAPPIPSPAPVVGSLTSSSSAALAPPPMPAPTPAPKAASTGVPEVDELIEAAIASRDLNDNEGALKALERADLRLPDHPAVLRQKALILGKMGQTEKANQLWDRIAKKGPSSASSSAPPPLAPTPQGNLSGAFGAVVASGPLSIGQCTVARDPTDTSGEKVVLKVPLKSAPGASISPADMNLDVFFFDRVDGAQIEPTKADPPVYSFDLPVDFANGEEVVTVVYHMPRLSEQERANFGTREYYGYVVKLYYQNRFMGTAGSPRDLLSPANGGAPAAPANPLLPPPTNTR